MRMLCFGDSNTYGYDPHAQSGDRYPAEARWVDILAGRTSLKIWNAGQNGREIPHLPPDLTQLDQLLADSTPEITVVMLGTNDLLRGASVSKVCTRMELLLRSILPICSSVLLVAPPPMQRSSWVPHSKPIAASAKLAAGYQALSQTLHIAFANAADWGVTLTGDGIHFSEAGHRAFAQGIFAALCASFQIPIADRNTGYFRRESLSNHP